MLLTQTELLTCQVYCIVTFRIDCITKTTNFIEKHGKGYEQQGTTGKRLNTKWSHKNGKDMQQK